LDICSDYLDGYAMGMLFCFIALVQHVVPLCLQWSSAQLFPAARTGRMG
jgi:hypothetical protein